MYVASNPKQFLGQSVGNGQCVAFAKLAANMPQTRLWKRGALVKGNFSLQAGAAIATFDANGSYGNHTDGSSHVAIYLGQDVHGIRVLDQWMSTKTMGGKPAKVPTNVHERVIYFRQAPRIENDGNNYYVVE